MIDRQHDRILLECDSCDEVRRSEPDEDWFNFWTSAKQDGWKSRKIGNNWVHGCPRCGV